MYESRLYQGSIQRRPEKPPMAISMLDGLVDFFTPANITRRLELRKQMRALLTYSMRFFFRRNLLITLCISMTVLLTFVFNGYLNYNKAIFSSGAEPLTLPANLVIGKRDTAHSLPALPIRPLPAMFTADELEQVSQNEAVESVTPGLKTDMELNGLLVNGVIVPSDSALARKFGIGTSGAWVFSNEPLDGEELTLAFSYQRRPFRFSDLTLRRLSQEYDYPGGPIVFLPTTLPAANQLFLECRDARQVKEALYAKLYPPEHLVPYDDSYLAALHNPFYYLHKESGKEMLANARDAQNIGFDKLVALVFVMSVLAVYNILVASYFDRQREAGILKTLGFTSNEVYVLLQSEVMLCALIAVGLAYLFYGLVQLSLIRFSSIDLILSFSQSTKIALVAVALFYFGSVLPGSLLRETSAARLLRGQAFRGNR